MPFRKRRMRGLSSSSPIPLLGKKIFTTPVITFLITFVIFATFIFGIFQIIRGFSLQKVLFLLGSDLDEDPYGHTNILLLGTGTSIHEGSDLTDTIIVASIDQEKNGITFLSIPRDLYIKDKKFGGMRINNLYFTAKKMLKSPGIGLELVREHVENVLGIKIQYSAKVDFNTFVEIIDAIGGIDMEIPETIFDPLYPKGETGLYETFFISKGFHHLDGATALKYARSRQTTSDFSRSERQQAILFAIKEKAAKNGIIKDKGTLEKIYDALKDKVETNLGMRDLIRLAEIGSEIQEKNIKNYLIHDDPSKCGGFLYPPDRDLYEGAFVLVPAGDSFEPLHKMANVVLNNSTYSGVKIQVLNGTKRSFLAGKTKVILKRHCIDVIRFGNGRSGENPVTTYYRKKNTHQVNGMISLLQQFIPGEISDQVPAEYLQKNYASDTEIILELGADYLRYEMKDPFNFIMELKKPEREETTDTKNDKLQITTSP